MKNSFPDITEEYVEGLIDKCDEMLTTLKWFKSHLKEFKSINNDKEEPKHESN